MKKLIMLSLLVLLITGLSASSRFTGIFTLNNNSAADVAFGNEAGTANIWNTSPLSVWSNPAKLGYHNGVTWGYSDDAWLEDFADDMYHTSSYLTVGWNGIGIMLPMPARDSEFGTYMTYGEQTETDEDGNQVGTFESYDNSKKYAVGVNLLQFSSNFFMPDHLNKIEQYGDLSIGYNYNKIESDLNPTGTGSSETTSKGSGESHSSGLGMIARISPINNHSAQGKFFNLDLTAGIYYLNHEKTKISYINESQSDPLPWGTNTAFSGKFSFKLSAIQALEHTPLSYFTDNLLSVYYSRDNTNYGEASNPSRWCEGVEFTVLDFFSYRMGESHNNVGLAGSTVGLGFNINFQDTFQFQYNVTSFPGGDLTAEQTKSDILVRVDFLKAYDMMR